MQVWNVLHAARCKYRTQKSHIDRHLHTIAQLCRVISSQLRHVSTIRKKLVKQQYLLHTFPQYGELQPINGWDLLASLGHTSKFHRVCFLCLLLQRCRSPEANQTLRDAWASPGLLHYIYILGALAPDRILPGTKFTLRPSLAFSYIGSVTARHSSSRHQPNFVVWYKELNYRTFADGATYIRQSGHHIGHWPTF